MKSVMYFLALLFSSYLIGLIPTYWSLDVTPQKIHRVSPAAISVLAMVKNPVNVTLVFSDEASEFGTESLRPLIFYRDYVKDLLNALQSKSAGKIKIKYLDPRPTSPDEVYVINEGLKHIKIQKEVPFYFGLIFEGPNRQTSSMSFLDPQDIAYLERDIVYSILDRNEPVYAKERRAPRIGIVSSFAVFKEQLSDLALTMLPENMRSGTWKVLQEISSVYEFKNVDLYNDNLSQFDVILIIHPKDLSPQGHYSIEQYLSKGGKILAFIDPFSYFESAHVGLKKGSEGNAKPSSTIYRNILNNWGVDYSENNLAAKPPLALVTNLPHTKTNFFQRNRLALVQCTVDCLADELKVGFEYSILDFIYPGFFKILPKDKNSPLNVRSLVELKNDIGTFKVNSPEEFKTPDVFLNSLKIENDPLAVAIYSKGSFKHYFDAKIMKAFSIQNPNHVDRALMDGEVIVFADTDFISDEIAYRQGIVDLVRRNSNALLMGQLLNLLLKDKKPIHLLAKEFIPRQLKGLEEVEATIYKKNNIIAKEITSDISYISSELGRLENLKSKVKILDDEKIVLEQQITTLQNKLKLAQIKLSNIKFTIFYEIEKFKSKIRNVNYLALTVLFVGLVCLTYFLRKKYNKI